MNKRLTSIESRVDKIQQKLLMLVSHLKEMAPATESSSFEEEEKKDPLSIRAKPLFGAQSASILSYADQTNKKAWEYYFDQAYASLRKLTGTLNNLTGPLVPRQCSNYTISCLRILGKFNGDRSRESAYSLLPGRKEEFDRWFQFRDLFEAFPRISIPKSCVPFLPSENGNFQLGDGLEYRVYFYTENKRQEYVLDRFLTSYLAWILLHPSCSKRDKDFFSPYLVRYTLSQGHLIVFESGSGEKKLKFQYKAAKIKPFSELASNELIPASIDFSSKKQIFTPDFDLHMGARLQDIDPDWDEGFVQGEHSKLLEEALEALGGQEIKPISSGQARFLKHKNNFRSETRAVLNLAKNRAADPIDLALNLGKASLQIYSEFTPLAILFKSLLKENITEEPLKVYLPVLVLAVKSYIAESLLPASLKTEIPPDNSKVIENELKSLPLSLHFKLADGTEKTHTYTLNEFERDCKSHIKTFQYRMEPSIQLMVHICQSKEGLEQVLSSPVTENAGTEPDFVLEAPPIIGLPNVGNSCYINASLQALFSSIQFLNLLDQANPEKPAGEELKKQLKNLLSNPIEARQHLLGLKKVLFNPKMHPDFERELQQQDAEAFISTVLESIGYQMLLRELRYGIAADEVKSSYSDQPMHVLSIEIPHSEDTFHSLTTLLVKAMFESIDDGTNQWEYERKKYLRNYQIQRQFIREVPPLMVIQLKRYRTDENQAVRKMAVPVDLPEHIDLSAMMAQGILSDGEQAIFKLAGTVNHNGPNPRGGHYTANINRGGLWYKVSDDTYSIPITFNELDKEQSYLLVYERIT